MKRNPFASWLAAVAAIGIVLPVPASANEPVAAISDIALRPGGLLIGQVVDPQGVAKAGTPVMITFSGKEVARTTTDENGVFAAKGLRGGQYEINTPESSSACRLWAADTAPPAARPAALVVAGNNLARGQLYGPLHGWKEWMKAHPYLTATVVVTSIGAPLLLADDDWDSGS
jgi:hypothetical protein